MDRGKKGRERKDVWFTIFLVVWLIKNEKAKNQFIKTLKIIKKKYEYKPSIQVNWKGLRDLFNPSLNPYERYPIPFFPNKQTNCTTFTKYMISFN